MRRTVLTLLGCLTTAASAQDGLDRNLSQVTFTSGQVGTLVSPTFGEKHQNQPGVVNGHLFGGGNAVHMLVDVDNPFAPRIVSTLEGPHHRGEAESHQLAFAQQLGGRVLAATISGLGVDLWDVSEPAAPILLHALELEGVRYGDNTEAVWGLAWDGRWLFVGGTSTGLWVVDTAVPTSPVVVARRTVAELGGVSAGPLWTLGNLLVVTTPKDHRGVATLDVGDPYEPVLLDAVLPEQNSYIGGFYGQHAWLLSPLRAYDVLTDPTSIDLVSTTETVPTEYLSFSDGTAWIGRLRPVPGVDRYDVRDPAAPELLESVHGRYDDVLRGFLTDDQFSFPLGNVVALCDDETRKGCVLAAVDARPDTTAPEILAAWPPEGSTRQPATTRIGLSLSDNVDVASLEPGDLELRRLDGSDPLPGVWGVSGTVVTFSPVEPLELGVTYEVVVPAGGIHDLFGNAVTSTTSWTFSTGEGIASLPCEVGRSAPVVVGDEALWDAPFSAVNARYTWEPGDGSPGIEGQRARHVYTEPGRYTRRLIVEHEGIQRACTGVQVVHRPLTANAPTTASTIAHDRSSERVVVVNPDADTVTMIDAETGTVRWEVPVGDRPRTLAVGPDDRVWVTGQDSDDLTVLNIGDGGLVGTVPLRHGAAPYGVALSPRGDRAYVSLEGTGELVAVDTADLRVVGRVVLEPGALRGGVRGVAVSADGATVYVSRFVSDAIQGSVYEVDAASLSVRATIPLAYDHTPDAQDAGRGVPSYLSHITISPDGRRAVVPGKKDNLSRGLQRDGERMNSDNTVRTVVSFLDLDAGEEAEEERLDLDDHEGAFSAAFSPLGDLVFVVSQGANRVDVRDAYDGHLVTAVSSGLAPNGAVVDGAGRLWVQDLNDRTVSLFDASTLLDGTDPRVRFVEAIVTVGAEPLSPEVLLGKQLFHNAASREMSQDGYIACASCHLDGHDDGRVWDFTDRGEGLRNTIDLRGRAGTEHGPLHWSANFDEVQDFEHDIRAAFGGSGFLSEADFADGRDDPLGAPKAGVSERLDALAAYVGTFDTFPRSPFRTEAGELTEDAKQGRRLLEELPCLDCHAGAALTDSPDGLLHDVGTITDATGTRMGSPVEGLDTPTLLGVWASPPYLHDGSADSIEEVLSRPGHGAEDLSDEERGQVAALLRQLEDRLPPVEDVDGARVCGCAGTGRGASPGLWWLLPLLGLRRRYGSAASSRSA